MTRELDVPADALWKLVAAFGDTSWMPAGAQVTLHGSGPGMERRIAAGQGKVIRERLEFADAASRTLVYTIPENVPFPVKDYRATMRVRAKGDGSELDWSVELRAGRRQRGRRAQGDRGHVRRDDRVDRGAGEGDRG